MVQAPEKAVALKPVDHSCEKAAPLPTVGMTVYQATAEIRPGQAVFVNGCLGGVGRARRPVRPGAGSLGRRQLPRHRG